MDFTGSSQRLFIFYLLPEFTMFAFAAAVDCLRLANEAVGYPAYRWRVASDDGQGVASSCGITISADSSVSAEKKNLLGWTRPSVVMVCGGKNVDKHSTRDGAAWLRECRQRGVSLGSLCTGTYVLASAGLLKNRRCTIHWENFPGLTEKFDKISVKTSLFETDKGIFTAAGGAATFDLMLHLIEQDFGNGVVSSICEQAILDRVRASTDRQRLPLSQRVQVLNPRVLKAISIMEDTLVEPIRLECIADKVGVSRRQLERLFLAEMECTPARYYLRLRLERARLLLIQTGLPIIEVAAACGFVSGSHFARSYRLENSMSPHETREKQVAM